MELGGGVVKRLRKPKYPEKQTINLALQETNKEALKVMVGGTILFLLCLSLFVKFAVINRVMAAREAKNRYLETEEEIKWLKERTEEFEEVQKVYRQFDDSFLGESELAELDRVDIINMVERSVLDRGEIEAISITSNQVMIRLESTTLPYVSEIVAALEAEEETVYVTVSTAETETSKQQDGTVSAKIMVQLKSGGDKNE